MTSIYDIPYEDIKEFLLANNKTYNNKDDAYDKASILLKDKKAIGHTLSIIEWIIAHNLLKGKINVPNYTTLKIDKMSSFEINNLSKLLSMKGNDRGNIKNILKFLHKLDDVVLFKDVILFDQVITVMHLYEFYEEYSDELNFIGRTQVDLGLSYDLDQIINDSNDLNILFKIGEDEDDFYQIAVNSNEGFTAGKILYEFTKYVYKYIKRLDVFDRFDGLVYITSILWNKDYNGYEIMFE